MNQPAFPAMHYDLADNEHGLTMRDYFAAKAMQAIISSDKYVGLIGVNIYERRTATDAYKMADAMLKERTA